MLMFRAGRDLRLAWPITTTLAANSTTAGQALKRVEGEDTSPRRTVIPSDYNTSRRTCATGTKTHQRRETSATSCEASREMPLPQQVQGRNTGWLEKMLKSSLHGCKTKSQAHVMGDEVVPRLVQKSLKKARSKKIYDQVHRGGSRLSPTHSRTRRPDLLYSRYRRTSEIRPCKMRMQVGWASRARPSLSLHSRTLSQVI